LEKFKKRVTLMDLALELGLSDRAVSQALNPRESNVKLNPKTVERVQKLAALRNYRRDSRARSMRYGRFYSIGYFEAKRRPHDWPLFGAEAGVYDEASAHGYQITLIRLPAENEGDSIPSVFQEAHLDAMIISHAVNIPEALEKHIAASGFPIIHLNEKNPHNAVYIDDVGGAEAMTSYLISLGNRKIAYLTHATPNSHSHYSNTDRRNGYIKAMRKAGLEPEIIEGSQSQPDAFFEWIDSHKDVEAIVCYNDLAALNLFRLTYRLPLKTPEHLAVTGFGDDIGRHCPIALTTMRNPYYEMGRAAVKMALKLVEESLKTVPSQVFSPELAIRNSTRNRLEPPADAQTKPSGW